MEIDDDDVDDDDDNDDDDDGVRARTHQIGWLFLQEQIEVNSQWEYQRHKSSKKKQFPCMCSLAAGYICVYTAVA